MLQVVQTVYQAALQEQTGACSPCCDGKNVCGLGLQCVKIVGEASGGICVPTKVTYSPAYCGAGVTLSNELVSCQRGDALSPEARQFLEPSLQGRRTRRMLQLQLPFGMFGYP